MIELVDTDSDGEKLLGLMSPAFYDILANSKCVLVLTPAKEVGAGAGE